MNKWKIFHIIKNNFYVLWFVFKRIPIRVVYDCFKSILGSIFYFQTYSCWYMNGNIRRKALYRLWQQSL